MKQPDKSIQYQRFEDAARKTFSALPQKVKEQMEQDQQERGSKRKQEASQDED